MLESLQYILYSVELASEKDHDIAEFKLNFLLKVPRSHIAIDIKTGFPNLIAFDRHCLEKYIRDRWHLYLTKTNRDKQRILIFIDGFIFSLEQDLPNFKKEYPNIQIESVSLTTFVDIISQSMITTKLKS